MVNTFDYLNIQFSHFSLLYSGPTNVLMNRNKIIFSIYISTTESNLQSICQWKNMEEQEEECASTLSESLCFSSSSKRFSRTLSLWTRGRLWIWASTADSRCSTSQNYRKKKRFMSCICEVIERFSYIHMFWWCCFEDLNHTGAIFARSISLSYIPNVGLVFASSHLCRLSSRRLGKCSYIFRICQKRWGLFSIAGNKCLFRHLKHKCVEPQTKHNFLIIIIFFMRAAHHTSLVSWENFCNSDV